MSESKSIDEKKLNSFMDKIFNDLSGSYTTLLCIIGDRLDLFKKLEKYGSITSQDFAQKSNTSERYAKEWLNGLTCAQYIEYNPIDNTFRLPDEHAQALTKEGGPMFVAGIYQSLFGEVKNLDRLLEAFQNGKGIPIEEYDKNEFLGTERMTSSWFENLLIQEWIPSIPGLIKKLKEGIKVADIGCGRGKAIVKLAKTFPNSKFYGYDIHKESIEGAILNAKNEKLDNNVFFKISNITNEGLPEKEYDLITTFDVIHDMAHPYDALQIIRKSLKDDGTYLLLEINTKDKLEDNIGPFGTLFYGWSIMYCMTVSLGAGGEGLGTAGLPESKVKEYCTRAGFKYIKKVPLDNPFNSLYEVKNK